jgi:hypothetical protein
MVTSFESPVRGLALDLPRIITELAGDPFGQYVLFVGLRVTLAAEDTGRIFTFGGHTDSASF